MSILCRLGWHEADGGEVYNSGYYFSSCVRCRGDMIRFGGAWQSVPAGHRVVWRTGRSNHSTKSDHGRFLPVLVADTRLPALRPMQVSRARAR
jgi:hypothetical protein